MKKKVLAGVLVAAMAAMTLVGCGGQAQTETPSTDNNTTTNTTTDTTTDDATTDTADAATEGKVLNIYTWNTEFIERLENCYPGYEVVEPTVSGKIGDVEVKYTTVASDNNGYQDNLDATLLAQADAADDDKVDLFLVEADYALKYTGSDVTMAMSDLGLDDSVFADQFQYTKDVVTAGGKLKGASWQGCPGALIYRADIAEDVLGTSDPDAVQESVKDWDTFLATAAAMKDKGYSMTCSANDSFRVFSNNVTSKWVDDNKNLNIDANIMNWVNMSKDMVAAGYTGTEDLWSDAWNNGFMESSNVFCYFGPAWLIDFCMKAGEEGSVATAGGWRVTPGPQGFFWGGTWVCAATGTDNKTLVADIIKTMTADASVLEQILLTYSDFVNSQSIIDSYKDNADFGDPILGGQNPFGIFAAGLASVDLSNISDYDQGCNESFQNAMKQYYTGTYATVEEALSAFYAEISAKYPAITVPQ